jgi:hypothetical protein
MSVIEDLCGSFGLHVVHDITTDCSCEQPYCAHTYQIWALSTDRDLSVGIFPYIVTPWFNSMEKLEAHCVEHREAIVGELQADGDVK